MKKVIAVVFALSVAALSSFSVSAADSADATIQKLESGAVAEKYTDIEQVAACRQDNHYTEPAAPTGYAGYKFAGWFLDAACSREKALGEEVTGEMLESGTTYYAKFVPGNILTVKAQVKAGTSFDKENSPRSDIRFVSTVDSSDYKSVGFDFLINGKVRHSDAIKTVYKKLYAVSDTNEVLGYTPKAFHAMSECFFAWTVRNVPYEAFGQGMEAKPYWVTLDGTKVYGTEDTKTVNMGYMPSVAEADTTVEFLIDRPKSLSFVGAQGGCTDGTYYYQASFTTSGGAYIVKYNMADGTLTKQYYPSGLDHANDLTYDSRKNVLVVCNNAPNYKRITFVNPSTLEIVEPSSLGLATIEGSVTVYDTYIELTADICGIDYNAYTDTYVVARSSKYGFWVYDSQFNDLNKKWNHYAATKNLTSQGISSDDAYIYNLLWNDNGSVEGYEGHVIEVYDWDGNFVTLINISADSETGISTTLEPENISVYKNVIYIACHNEEAGNVTVYKVTGLEQSFEASIGSNKYATLKEAVENANAKDTVTVLKNITVNTKLSLLNDLTITNTTGKDIVITRGNSLTDHVFENNSGGTFIIQGASSGTLTIDGNKENVQGKSLVYNGSSSVFELEGATLQNAQTSSSSSKNGAALNNQGTATLNGNIKNNVAAEHGAVLNQGVLTITGGEYSQNRAVKDGGAIYTTGNVIVNGGTFTGNSAVLGGAICRGGGTITLTMNGGTFTGNHAANAGGAIYWGSGTMSISNVTMTGNSVSAESTSYGGRAIVVGGSTKLTLTNVKINNNITFYRDQDHPGSDIVFANNGSSYPYLILTDNSFDGVVSWYEPNGKYKGRVQLNEAYAENEITFCKTSCLEVGDILVEFGKNFTGDPALTVNHIAVREYTSANESNTDLYYIDTAGKLQGCEASVRAADNSITYHKTFAEAMTAVNAMGTTEQITITVLQDVTLKSKYSISKNVKIRGNNKTIDIGSLTGGIFEASGQLEFDGYDGGTLTLEGNAAKRAASATRIVLNSSGKFTLGKNAVIQNLNTTWQGGAVYNNGTGMSQLYGKISQIISSNQGGAIFNSTNAKMVISGSNLEGNQGSDGGAIHNRGTLTLTDSNLLSNISTERGGGICNVGEMTISGCYFYMNKNNGTVADGGAVYNSSAKENRITDTIFVENYSARNGGAIANQSTNSKLTVSGCGFKKNTCNTSGGAICNHSGTTISIDSTWFVDNTRTTYTDPATGIKIVGLYNGGTISRFENVTTVEPETR